MRLLSVQPFGINDPGGGPRILRAVLTGQPHPVELVCTGGARPAGPTPYREWWCPTRPRFGPAERTRLARGLDWLEWPLQPRLRARIEAICHATRPDVLHAVAHGTDFVGAHEMARRHRLGFVLSAHDDLRYALRGRPDRALALRKLGAVWRDADARLVISNELGDEYNRRYGHRPYTVVTDGLLDEDIASRPHPVEGLRIYFAGLFHLAYGDNLRALLRSLEGRTGSTPVSVHVSVRCAAGRRCPLDRASFSPSLRKRA